MIIHISTSGGIGGFGLGKRVDVPVSDLPEPLRDQVCEHFTPEALTALSGRGGAPGAADCIVYSIVVEDGGARTEYRLSDRGLPAAMLDLIDEVMSAGR